MVTQLWLDGQPPNGNELHRMTHWAVRASREEWRLKAWASARRQELEPVRGPVRLRVTWHFKVNRRRDLDNLIAGLKPVLDGLVDAGLIEGDDTRTVREITGRVLINPGPVGLVLRIESAE